MVRSLTGHTSDVNALELLSNGYLASGSSDSYSIIWNPSSGAQIGSFIPVNSHAVTCMKQINPTQLAIGGVDDSVYFWNITNSASPARIDITSSFVTVNCTDINMYDAEHIVVSSRSPNVYCFSASTRALYGWISFSPNNVFSLEYLSMA